MPEDQAPAMSRMAGRTRNLGGLVAAISGAAILATACQLPPRAPETGTVDGIQVETEANTASRVAMPNDAVHEPIPESTPDPTHEPIHEPITEPMVTATPHEASDEGRASVIADEALLVATANSDDMQIGQSGPGDLLDRIRAGYQFEIARQDSTQAKKRIAQQFDWFQRHPDYMNRVFTRAQPYLFHIVESIEARGMPAELALLPIVESAFDPFAYSHGRAAGLWQFIPGTGKHYGLKQNWWYDGRRDVTESTRAALDYLEKLAAMFDGDYLLAVAAYNSGEGIVRRAVRRNQRAGQPTDFWHLRLPPETRAYVPKLLALRELVRIPAEYGLELPIVEDQKYFAAVATDGQIDLALAADLAGIDLDELYALNPGFNRWATDPDGPHSLLVPEANAPVFMDALQKLPPTERVRWQRHRIKSGDNLGAIARRYGTTVNLIKDVNNLRGTNIRVGDDLMIPSARLSLASYSKSEEGRLARLQKTARGRSKTTYVVRPGDSFWEIARSHGVEVRKLAGWNGMSPRDTLSVGRKLVIWDASSRQASTAATPPGDRTLRRISYTVRKGDSFARISGRFRVSVAQLQKWNKAAARQKYLRPGQKLTVYVDVTRQTG